MTFRGNFGQWNVEALVVPKVNLFSLWENNSDRQEFNSFAFDSRSFGLLPWAASLYGDHSLFNPGVHCLSFRSKYRLGFVHTKGSLASISARHCYDFFCPFFFCFLHHPADTEMNCDSLQQNGTRRTYSCKFSFKYYMLLHSGSKKIQ